MPVTLQSPFGVQCKPYGETRSAEFDGTDGTTVFFSPEKKKVLHEKIFKILPEKIGKCPRKNLKNCPRKKSCTREKISKITPEKKKYVGEKKIKNSTRENSKSTREKIDINIY